MIEMSDLGAWFEKMADGYSPWKASSLDSLVCHEVGAHYGGYENSVLDGYYEEFPLHRSDCVEYAYDLYMKYLPKGVRYQGKAHFKELAEKVVKGMEEAWGCEWCPEGKVVPCND